MGSATLTAVSAMPTFNCLVLKTKLNNFSFNVLEKLLVFIVINVNKLIYKKKNAYNRSLEIKYNTTKYNAPIV